MHRLFALLALILGITAEPAQADSSAVAFRFEMPFGGQDGTPHHLSFQTDPVLAERVSRLNEGLPGGESFTAPPMLQPTDPHSEFYVPPLVDFNWHSQSDVPNARWYLPWVVEGRDLNLRPVGLGATVLNFGSNALNAGSRAWQALSLRLHPKAEKNPKPKPDASAAQR